MSTSNLYWAFEHALDVTKVQASLYKRKLLIFPRELVL